MTETDQNRLIVSSPLSGWCAGLDDSPDPVFREGILGDGLSVDPTLGEVRAPFDGEVLTVPDSRHAINLRARCGAEFLIHVGIDSVKMAGEGFIAHVKPGDRIKTGQLLLEFDLELVLRKASSLKTPVLLLQSDDYEIDEVHPPGSVSAGEELLTVRRLAGGQQDTPESEQSEQYTRMVTVGLEHGIHARPAAMVVSTVKSLDARVYCQIGEKDAADAGSAVALMSLGVSHGDRLTISASGAEAQQALDAIEEVLESLPFDAERNQALEAANSEIEAPEMSIEAPADGTRLNAQTASPGLGMGKAFSLSLGDDIMTPHSGSLEQEQKLLEEAVSRVRSHLLEVTASDQETAVEIATAHLALLDDPLINSGAEERLSDGSSASQAWRASVNTAAETLQQLDDQRMRERVDDLFDINLRVQRALAGQEPGKGPEVPAGSIILAENMLPSQLIELDTQNVSGICLAAGGATSHVAILALSKNIPMLVAAGESILAIESGSELLLDAEYGELHVRPDAGSAARFQDQVAQFHERQQAELKHALDECITSDGKHIHINANLASVEDAIAAVKAGAEGCGLLRTEFAFMDRISAPGIDEQLEIYRPIADALGSRPLVVRTLDAGGDKPIGYITQPEEENPALGIRGIRLSLLNRDMLRIQLEALLELGKDAPLHIMIPMVSNVHEVHAVREILNELIPAGDDRAQVQLGIMIETPAAALIADQLAELVDFFSIGTNDLTQYTLCMDREESHFSSDLDVLHPAVLRLIKNTADAASRADIPVAVCGGAAGDMLAAPILLGLGIRELSMSTSLIARQKALLRQVSVEECTRQAGMAMKMSTGNQVREMMREFVTKQTNYG